MIAFVIVGLCWVSVHLDRTTMNSSILFAISLPCFSSVLNFSGTNRLSNFISDCSDGRKLPRVYAARFALPFLCVSLSQVVIGSAKNLRGGVSGYTSESDWELLSPQMGKDIVWFLRRWAKTYLLVDEKLYSQVSYQKEVNQCVETAGMMSEWSLRFLFWLRSKITHKFLEPNLDIFMCLFITSDSSSEFLSFTSLPQISMPFSTAFGADTRERSGLWDICWRKWSIICRCGALSQSWLMTRWSCWWHWWRRERGLCLLAGVMRMCASMRAKCWASRPAGQLLTDRLKEASGLCWCLHILSVDTRPNAFNVPRLLVELCYCLAKWFLNLRLHNATWINVN